MVSDPAFFCLLLRETCAGYFRKCIEAGRDTCRSIGVFFAQCIFRGGFALCRGCVRQHDFTDTVTDRIYASNICLQIFVHKHLAALVTDPAGVQIEIVRIWAASQRCEKLCAWDRACVSFRNCRYFSTGILVNNTSDLVSREDLDPLLFQLLAQQVA